MATRSEKGARIAGIIVAIASIGIMMYNAFKPMLIGEDPWLIAVIAVGVAVLLVGTVVLAIWHRRRSISRAIRRK